MSTEQGWTVGSRSDRQGRTQDLPPHSWDDDVHRAAIHACFDQVTAAAGHGRSGYQVARLIRELRRLADDASQRRGGA